MWRRKLTSFIFRKIYNEKLSVKSGKKVRPQYYRIKDEANDIVSGKTILRYNKKLGELEEKEVGLDDWFHFSSGCIHQEKATIAVERIAVSIPHFNDRNRVESRYGLSDRSKLKITSSKGIVER